MSSVPERGVAGSGISAEADGAVFVQKIDHSARLQEFS
jgi:streptogramin lyase